MKATLFSIVDANNQQKSQIDLLDPFPCWNPRQWGCRQSSQGFSKYANDGRQSTVEGLLPTPQGVEMEKVDKSWEMQPQANKLRYIRDDLTKWESSFKSRTAEVTLARLRIGHTRLTQVLSWSAAVQCGQRYYASTFFSRFTRCLSWYNFRTYIEGF